MTFRSEDWARVRAIFADAVARNAVDRSEFVTQACAGDQVLRSQVEALLVSHDDTAGFLDAAAVPGPSPGPDLTGTTTSGYRVLSRLGAGGMGEVYLAHDDQLDRPVALKLLSSQVSADRAQLRRFHEEAKAASSLNHPHIVVIHAFGELNGRPYIVSEYIEGCTLRQRLRAGRLGLDEALDIASQIASALAAAHASGLVHRDVKPENVMIRPDGYVKVLDFGLAKRVALDDVDGLTQPGLLLGTPRYMSPEQARGIAVDPRSDVWSLGVVLYEMLAGHPPFAGQTPMDVLTSILHSSPPPVPDLPRGVADCLARALGKAPADRFADGRELHSVLLGLRSSGEGRSDSDGGGSHGRAGSAPRRRKMIDSIAVLPFVMEGAAPDTEYLADGITESVINALSQLPKLRVMARNTVFRYKGRAADAQTVGRELGVRAVLVGHLRSMPDGYRIAIELVDAVDGSQVWGGQMQRGAADALTVQEQTAAEIAEQLRPRLSTADRKRIAKRPTADPRAFEAYLKGRYHLAKRTMDGFTKAIACFDQAIAHDNAYALAYAGLADCWTLLGAAAYGEPSAQSMAKARTAAEQAVRLDLAGNEAEVHSALGFVRFRIDWNWIEAEGALKRACELSPGNAAAHHRLALLLSALGRHEEALFEIRTAHELDPLSLIISTAVGRVLHFQRHYDDAVEQCRRTLEMDHGFVQASFDLGMSLAQAGRADEAIAAFESVLPPEDPRSVMRAVFCHMCGRAGRVQQAEAILADLERRYRRGEASSYDLALALIGLGRTSEGLDWLERAHESHLGLLVFLKVEPMFDCVRSEPRFAALMARMKFP